MKTNIVVTCLLLSCVSIGFANQTNTKCNNTSLSWDSPQNAFQDTTDMSVHSIWRYAGIRMYTDSPWVIEVKVLQDTVIDGKVCRVLGSWFDGVYQEDSPLPVYYKENKMFYHEDGQFWPIYDFNLQVGDTMQTFISKNAHAYSVIGGFQELTDELRLKNPYKLVIEKIDTVEASNGRKLTRFFTDHETEIGLGNVVQDIGSEFGFGGIFIGHTADVGWYDFLCYKNEEYVYPDEAACSPTSSKDIHEDLITFTPNPVTEFLRITSKDYIPENGIVRIYDWLGKQMCIQPWQVGDHIVDMKSYPSGLFMVTIEEAGKIIQSKKIVKL